MKLLYKSHAMIPHLHVIMRHSYVAHSCVILNLNTSTKNPVKELLYIYVYI
jgi:hypothetical protein